MCKSNVCITVKQTHENPPGVILSVLYNSNNYNYIMKGMISFLNVQCALLLFTMMLIVFMMKV